MNLQKGMFLTFQGKGFKGLNFIDMEELSRNPNITEPTLQNKSNVNRTEPTLQNKANIKYLQSEQNRANITIRTKQSQT